MTQNEIVQPTLDAEDLGRCERRTLVGGGVAVAASAVLGGLVAVAACSDSAATTSSAAQSTTDADIDPLNALLTAEYDAIAAYSAGASLIMKAPDSDPLYAMRDVIVKVALDFQSHHELHAEALEEAIKDLKGTPVDEAKTQDAFKPPAALVDNPSIMNVLKFAAAAERGATVAYNQALAGMENAKYRLLASSIGGDESQHFIVLAALVLGLAAPGPKLSADTADELVPQAFVATIDEYEGLDKAPPDYFA
jgi:ferritin-like protein